MGKKRNYANDGLDLSGEYFRKKKNDNVNDFCFTPEEPEPSHY